jgi:ABC-2 type transport system permease protein
MAAEVSAMSMTAVARYLRLLSALGRYGLAGEMAFRANFLVKVTVEVLWLFLLIAFYRTVFSKTSKVAGWSESEYLFFVGCYFALEGLVETFFLSNCTEFAELIRTGDLDFILLKPIDEQFLVTCRNMDWSTAPNVLMGFAVMGFALWDMQWQISLLQAGLFALLFTSGLAIAYSFLLILMSTSVWLVRNQNLMELWWLFTSLMRYPREIFTGTWASPMGWFFTFIVPVLIVVNVPAHAMVKVVDLRAAGMMLVAAAILLFASRRFFRYALRKYRSASS